MEYNQRLHLTGAVDMTRRFIERIAGVHMPAAWYPMKFAPKDGRIIVLKSPHWLIMPVVRWTTEQNAEGWEFLNAAFNQDAPLFRLGDTKWIHPDDATKWASLASTGITIADVFPDAH